MNEKRCQHNMHDYFNYPSHEYLLLTNYMKCRNHVMSKILNMRKMITCLINEIYVIINMEIT